MILEVTTTYLEMTSLKVLRPKAPPVKDAVVRKVEIPVPSLNHYFFVHVGRRWRWYSRLAWTFDDWKAWAARRAVSTWMGLHRGAPFGYIELEKQRADVELSFIGLLPQFYGQGLGGFLLSEAIRIAWEQASERVWVHTCTLDHPHALANYLARGFTIYKQETKQEQIPEETDPIWSTPAFHQSLLKAYDPIVHR